jgi:hypothetical protein
MSKIVFLLVLMPFLAFGQQHFPLIKDGGVWREAISTINTPPDPWHITKFQYLMEGDTIINSVAYKKIYSCDYSPSITNKVFFGGIREDSLEKVFIFLDSNQVLYSNNLQFNTEYLLYDFSLNVGDTLKIMNLVDSVQILQSIDSILIDNTFRKRWNFNANSLSQREVIEGIGSTKGLFFPLQWEFENYQLLTCYEDSNLFWSNPELQGVDCFSVGIKENNKEKYNVTVNPNPTSGKLNIELAEIPKETVLVELYDISGRLIKLNKFINQTNFSLDISDLQNGIYLLNIRSEEVYSKSIKVIKN